MSPKNKTKRNCRLRDNEGKASRSKRSRQERPAVAIEVDDNHTVQEPGPSGSIAAQENVVGARKSNSTPLAPAPVPALAIESQSEVSEVKVWCVGSSIIKNAMMASVCRPGGTNLGLDRLKINIWWQGYSGLNFLGLKRKLFFLTEYEESPDFLVIHCGANDLGSIDLYTLIEKIKSHLKIIKTRFPHSTLVWSQMLPRNKWRYSGDNKAMERSRLKANRVAASLVLELGGCYIKYPDLLKNISQFLLPDGVHLNDLGNKLFLNNIQGGLEFFLSKQGNVYP
ncbi:uncharacterized protein LOC134245048 [Saccostrea cucullata]|uniref:uncharacterized protein LOC134245048 n=1 Tax=Saccostrea cuccullata TaxID=36930 RepID=UPI002ED2BED5